MAVTLAMVVLGPSHEQLFEDTQSLVKQESQDLVKSVTDIDYIGGSWSPIYEVRAVTF